jgi:hypothetical protein
MMKPMICRPIRRQQELLLVLLMVLLPVQVPVHLLGWVWVLKHVLGQQTHWN